MRVAHRDPAPRGRSTGRNARRRKACSCTNSRRSAATGCGTITAWTPMASDPMYDDDWREWILTVRRQIGIVDLADMIYVRSREYLRRNAPTGPAAGARKAAPVWREGRQDRLGQPPEGPAVPVRRPAAALGLSRRPAASNAPDETREHDSRYCCAAWNGWRRGSSCWKKKRGRASTSRNSTLKTTNRRSFRDACYPRSCRHGQRPASTSTQPDRRSRITPGAISNSRPPV